MRLKVIEKTNAHTVYLGLGSNMGDRGKNIQEAINRLNSNCNMVVVSVSPLYNTAPFGFESQPDFLNGAAEIRTNLAPYEVLEACMDVEKSLGRIRTLRWGPRIIDLDILFYDDMILNDERLVIPHPLLHEREFVLLPLKDIAPEITHPIYKISVLKMYETLYR